MQCKESTRHDDRDQGGHEAPGSASIERHQVDAPGPVALGSQQARVCAIDGDVCEYVVFVETEGGGTARRCRVPINSGSCQVGFGDTTDSQCVDLFTCNLLLGNCPSDIMPGTSVITCR